MAELRASQGLSDASCFVATVVRVGCSLALNMKLIHIRNIVIVILKDADNKKFLSKCFWYKDSLDILCISNCIKYFYS